MITLPPVTFDIEILSKFVQRVLIDQRNINKKQTNALNSDSSVWIHFIAIFGKG